MRQPSKQRDEPSRDGVPGVPLTGGHPAAAVLEKVQEGEPALSPAIARKLLQEFARPAGVAARTSDPDALTEREREILGLLVEGVTSNRKLARSLGVTENTVKFHIRHILDKLHLHSRAQAVGYALRNRLLEPPED